VDSGGGGSGLGEDVPFGLHFVLYLLLRIHLSDDYCIAYSVLSDVFGRYQLRMSIINNFVNDFINEHKVFSNGFFIQHSAVVSENFHHSVDDVHDETG
jgi:hypothetical protein